MKLQTCLAPSCRPLLCLVGRCLHSVCGGDQWRRWRAFRLQKPLDWACWCLLRTERAVLCEAKQTAQEVAVQR